MTAGEGGLLVTRDIRTYERAARMHDLGQYRPYHRPFTPPQEPAFSGANYRMSELTASVALVQLNKVDAIKSHCRMIQQKIRDEVGDLPGITWRSIADPAGDFGFEMYFYLDNAAQVEPFQSALNVREVNCLPRTGTYPQYYRENILTGRAHHPAASPFRDLKPWPAPGYRPPFHCVTYRLEVHPRGRHPHRPIPPCRPPRTPRLGRLPSFPVRHDVCHILGDGRSSGSSERRRIFPLYHSLSSSGTADCCAGGMMLRGKVSRKRKIKRKE
jgi:hypothetical protein